MNSTKKTKKSNSLRNKLILVGLAVIGGFLATLREPQQFMVVIGLLVVIAPLFFHKSSGLHWYRFLGLGLLLAFLEVVAVKSGLPYGVFRYTYLMQPMVAGLPLLMIVLWPTILLAATYSAQEILSRHNIKDHLATFILTVLLVVGFDLVMDPGATAMGLWQWLETGGYYGVPASNFIGWVVFGVIGYGLTQVFKVETAEKYLLPLVMLAAFWSSYNLFIGYYVAAALGAMLTLLFFSAFSEIQSQIVKEPVGFGPVVRDVQ